MYTTAVFPSKYVQGPGVTAELPGQIEAFGGRAFIIATRSAFGTVIDGIRFSLGGDSVIEHFGGECHKGEIGRFLA